MSSSLSTDSIAVRVYRRVQDTLGDLLFVILLVCVLLGASVRMLKHCIK